MTTFFMGSLAATGRAAMLVAQDRGKRTAAPLRDLRCPLDHAPAKTDNRRLPAPSRLLITGKIQASGSGRRAECYISVYLAMSAECPKRACPDRARKSSRRDRAGCSVASTHPSRQIHNGQYKFRIGHTIEITRLGRPPTATRLHWARSNGYDTNIAFRLPYLPAAP